MIHIDRGSALALEHLVDKWVEKGDITPAIIQVYLTLYLKLFSIFALRKYWRKDKAPPPNQSDSKKLSFRTKSGRGTCIYKKIMKVTFNFKLWTEYIV